MVRFQRIRCTVDEREQKKLMMDLEVVMKSNSCPVNKIMATTLKLFLLVLSKYHL